MASATGGPGVEWDVIPPIGVVEGWVDQLEAEEVDLPE
jgi:hypothetical protein